MYRDRHKVSSRLCRTKVYFLVIAILMTFTIIVLSYRWNVAGRVYKISSHETHVHISNHGNIPKATSDLGQIRLDSEPKLQGTNKGNFNNGTVDLQKIMEPILGKYLEPILGKYFQSGKPMKSDSNMPIQNVELNLSMPTTISRHSLVTTRHSLVTTRHSVVTTRHSLVTTRQSLVTTRHSLVTTRHSLVTTRHSLVTTRQSLPNTPTTVSSTNKSDTFTTTKTHYINKTAVRPDTTSIHTSRSKSETKQIESKHNATEANKERLDELIKHWTVIAPSELAKTKEEIMITDGETDLEIPPTSMKTSGIQINVKSTNQTLKSTHNKIQGAHTENKVESIQNTTNVKQRDSERRTLMTRVSPTIKSKINGRSGDPNTTKQLNKLRNGVVKEPKVKQKLKNSKKDNKKRLQKLKDEIKSDIHQLNKGDKSSLVRDANKINSTMKWRNKLSNYNKLRSEMNAISRKMTNNRLLGGIGDRFHNSVGNKHITVRPDVCHSCFTVDFKNMINEEVLCKDKEVTLLILITSVPNNHESRDAIRETWGHECVKPNSNIKCAFVFGNRNNSADNQILIEEHNKHHDILQFDFKDSYANLTYKTMVLFKWSQEFCPEAKFVMKTDDDMWVNTELLPVFIEAAPTRGFLGGCCWGSSPPHRDVTSKWHVPYHMFTKPLYPPMCSGTGYIATPDVIAGILRVSPNIPYFYLEDVYVALCLKEIGVHPKNLMGFHNVLAEYSSCDYRYRYLTSHYFNAGALRYIWDLSHECPEMEISPSMVYSATTIIH